MVSVYSILQDNYKRFLRFGTVGVANTAIDFSVFTLLYYVFHVPPVAAHVSGFLLAVINSFIWNTLWTFNHPDRGKNAALAVRFFTAALIMLGISSLALWLLARYLPVLLAKILVIGIMMFAGYLINARFVFRDRDMVQD